jgi:hypothetical protein
MTTVIMPTATLRASYSISAPTLQRFNAVVPPGERSKVVEFFMQSALAEKENALEAIANTFMTDEAFAGCRETELAWDVTVGDGLDEIK